MRTTASLTDAVYLFNLNDAQIVSNDDPLGGGPETLHRLTKLGIGNADREAWRVAQSLGQGPAIQRVQTYVTRLPGEWSELNQAFMLLTFSLPMYRHRVAMALRDMVGTARAASVRPLLLVFSPLLDRGHVPAWMSRRVRWDGTRAGWDVRECCEEVLVDADMGRVRLHGTDAGHLSEYGAALLAREIVAAVESPGYSRAR